MQSINWRSSLGALFFCADVDFFSELGINSQVGMTTQKTIPQPRCLYTYDITTQDCTLVPKEQVFELLGIWAEKGAEINGTVCLAYTNPLQFDRPQDEKLASAIQSFRKLKAFI